MAAKKKQNYMGNTNLPSANSAFEYTPEMVVEIEKCRNDIIHFAANYFYIIDPDSDVGKVNIQLYDFQKRILKGVFDNRFNVILSPRQASKALALDTPIPTPNGWTTTNLEDRFGSNNWSIQGTGLFVGGQTIKIAGAYKDNDITLYVNGVQIGTNTTANAPQTEKLRFANNTSGSLGYLGSHKDVKLYNTRLSNSELEALTTI